jgi:predicted DNA-binding protein
LPFKSFYWPNSEEAKRLWKEAKEIAKREGKSVSQLIREFLESYIHLHEPGNPQQRLDTIIRLGKKYVAPKVCMVKDCMRDAVAVATYLNDGKDYFLCEEHLKEIGEYRNWRFKKFLEG